VRLRLVAAGVAACALLAGCSGGSSKGATTPGPSGGSASSKAAQLKLAKLSPCPTSSSTAVSGGLPDLTFSCLGNGPAVHLSGLTGQPTVVNLWGSWCGPCQKEAAYLSAVALADKGKVRFLGVDSEDDPAGALNFDWHVSPPVHYPSVSDPDRKLQLALHFHGPPATMFLNAAGKVVHVNGGPYTSAAQVRADIATYLHVT
jgi:thiol-disulfide isomerase/thioredoxin